jgi:hypothetical protein
MITLFARLKGTWKTTLESFGGADTEFLPSKVKRAAPVVSFTIRKPTEADADSSAGAALAPISKV